MSFATGRPAPTGSAGQAKTVTVIQGEIEISNDPKVILSTILGSCVAVCLWDQRAGVGGMNHFLLAQGGARNDVKYGAYAMEMLINRLLRAGAQRSAFQCKVFGGATLSGFGNEIGRANAAFARKFLADEEIACVAESLGGGSAAPHQIQPDHRESANAFCTACRRRTGDTASRNCHTRHNNVLTVGMLSTSPPTHGR